MRVAPSRAAVSGGRALGVAAVGLGVAAAAFWGASSVAPPFVGVALATLAAVAALVGTAGVLRRVLAGLIGLAGLAVIGAVTGLGAPVLAAVLAVAGGVLLLGTGVFVLLREPRLARLGARYAAAPTDPPPASDDPDRAAWAALDAGLDPTLDPGPDARIDPGSDLATGPSTSAGAGHPAPPAEDPDDPGGDRRHRAV